MASPEYLTVRLTFKEIKRIFAKITVDPETECWIWSGPFDKDGYGFVKYRGRMEKIHRVMFAWLTEPLPRGHAAAKYYQIHHLCNNPPCCNPAHLTIVTRRANILMGDGITAQNARKSRCPRGHVYDTILDNGGRWCSICKRIQTRHNARTWRSRHPDRSAANVSQYYQMHRAAIKEYHRNYHAKKKAAKAITI